MGQNAFYVWSVSKLVRRKHYKRDSVDNLIKDKTVFLIAHRFTTIKNANRILVINEGELVEQGTHDELMQIEGGQYKHLYEMQFRNQA